jgi:serine/threonine protein kinase
LLSGTPIKSTSGKSQIWTAYRSDDDGLPTGEPVVVKVSAVTDAIERELNNYGVVTRGFTKGQFVKCLDYYPEAAGDRSNDKSKRQFMNQCALVMERGNEDLKTFVAGHSRGLEGHALRDAAMAAAQCLKALHSSNMVWTDLKTENFIVMDGTGDDGSILVKGIDLESAMPARDNPVDYSPEACPPEFAQSFLSGNGPYFELDYSYDVWSYGMFLFEIATGDGIFDGHNPTQVTKKLADPNYEVNVDKIPDTRLRNLAKACLRRDPAKRPSVTQIMLHSYFLTSYSPFSTFRRQ